MCSLLGGLGISDPLGAATSVAGVGADGTEGVEDALLLVGLGDGGELDLLLSLGNGHKEALGLDGGGGRLELGGGGVGDLTLLRLVLLAGEQDHLALVLVEAGNVELQLLLAHGGAAVVNGDADGAGKLGGDASLLELDQGEATAKTDLAGVLAGSGGHDGAEILDGTGEELGSLGLTRDATGSLLAGLVEVSLDSLLPVLAEMHVGNRVVVLDHC